MKYIIFDSGPIINFAMNGLLPVLKKLRKEEADKLSAYLVSPEWAEKVKEIAESTENIGKPPRTSLEAAVAHEQRLDKLDELISNLYSRVSLIEKIAFSKGDVE